MRGLIAIKDADGIVKVCQFIGLVDDKDDSKAVAHAKEYFEQFCINNNNIEKLKAILCNIRTFTTDELLKFSTDVFLNSKYAVDYYNTYVSPISGIKFLDTLIKSNGDIKLYSYVNHIDDYIFAPIVFEIDYQTKFATVKINGTSQITIDIGNNCTDAEKLDEK